MGKKKEAAAKAPRDSQKALVNPVINLPGLGGDAIWDELVGEAKRLIMLVEELRGLSLDAPEREAHERELIDSLSHLAVHSSVLDERLEDALIDQASPEELDEILKELRRGPTDGAVTRANSSA